MLDLKDLATPYRHPAKEILSKYCTIKVAENIGITTGYLYSVLRGSTRPSKALNDRINRFAAAVVAAEKNN